METGDSRRGIAEVCTTMESVFTGEDEASWDGLRWDQREKEGMERDDSEV